MQNKRRSRRRSVGAFRAGPSRYLAHILAWSYVLALALPLYYLIVSSMKSTIEIVDQPFAPSLTPSFDNFVKAFQQASLGEALISSIYVTVGAELITLAATLPAAYAIARTRGKSGRVLEAVFGAGFLTPGFAALVPSVMLAIAFNMFHTREFLILLLGVSAVPLSVLLFVQAMKSVPPSLKRAPISTVRARFGCSGASISLSPFPPWPWSPS